MWTKIINKSKQQTILSKIIVRKNKKIEQKNSHIEILIENCCGAKLIRVWLLLLLHVVIRNNSEINYFVFKNCCCCCVCLFMCAMVVGAVCTFLFHFIFHLIFTNLSSSKLTHVSELLMIVLYCFFHVENRNWNEIIKHNNSWNGWNTGWNLLIWNNIHTTKENKIPVCLCVCSFTFTFTCVFFHDIHSLHSVFCINVTMFDFFELFYSTPWRKVGNKMSFVFYQNYEIFLESYLEIIVVFRSFHSLNLFKNVWIERNPCDFGLSKIESGSTNLKSNEFFRDIIRLVREVYIL